MRVRAYTTYIIGLLLCCFSAVRAEDSIGTQNPETSIPDTIQNVHNDSVINVMDSVVSNIDSIFDGLPDKISNDSIAPDSIPADSVGGGIKKKNSISAPVYYQSSDSMVMTRNGNAYLHGKGEVKYENMALTSEFIRMNLDSSLVNATILSTC